MYAIAIGGAPDDRFADSFRGTIVIDLALSQMTRLNASRFIHPKGAASTTFRGSTSSWAASLRRSRDPAILESDVTSLTWGSI